MTLPDVTLAPGQWTQLNRVLASAGYANGWATVERVAGTDRFYAYGVVNDNLTGDGAFVAPVAGRTTRVRSDAPGRGPHGRVHDGALPHERGRDAAPTLLPGLLVGQGRQSSSRDEQRFIPDVLSYLGVSGFRDAAWISSNGGAAAFHASARTFSSTPVGGTFGVAYPAITALGGGAVGDVGLRAQAGRTRPVESRLRNRRASRRLPGDNPPL